MQKRIIYVVVVGLMIALGVGSLVRYEVLQGRSLPAPEAVTDFSSCLNAHNNLDSTGNVCTTLTGQIYLKPGVLPTPPTAATTTVPSTTTTTTITTLPLGSPTVFKINDTKTFTGGITLTLTAINDSRCKPNVQCIWAGEFAPVWTVKTANGAVSALSLGTVRNTTQTSGGYQYTLTTANAESASITVVTAPLPTTIGMVSGKVAIGPICPVESVDHPCAIPPETYTSRSVIVYAADLKTELSQHPLDATGHYSFSLKPGTYGLQIRPAGIGAGEIRPVVIKGNTTTTTDFTIDTGIR